jgi:hypothetical protein
MRRLLAALTLCVSLLCPVASRCRLNRRRRGSQIPRPKPSTSPAPARSIIATDAGTASKIPISLKDAKAKGYTACKVCRPAE